MMMQEQARELSKTPRQGHRWVAGAFLIAVTANLAVYAVKEPPEWVAYLPLLPLLLLMMSGMYLLVLPYRRRQQAGSK